MNLSTKLNSLESVIGKIHKLEIRKRYNFITSLSFEKLEFLQFFMLTLGLKTNLLCMLNPFSYILQLYGDIFIDLFLDCLLFLTWELIRIILLSFYEI